jgi:hypothetical protein
MAVVFPELKTFFTGSVSSIAPVRLIAGYPTPAEIAEVPAEEVREVLWRARAYHHAHRVEELQALAHGSSGLLPDPQRAWRLAWVTDFLVANFKADAGLDKQIEGLVTQRKEYPWTANVPYAGPAT